MKVLITGGAGFVGSHLVDRLVRDGHDVIVIDHHKREKMRFPNKQARTHKVSFTDKEAMRGVLGQEKPDAIVHLAAQISVTRSIQDPVQDAMVNIVGSVQLLDLARETGCKQILFASSGGAIYGDHPVRPTPEIFDAKPISPYGIGKQTFEHYLDLYSDLYGMKAGVLRFANIYGPRQLPKGEAAVMAIFLKKLFAGEEVVIFGDGTSARDYVFVEDAVDAFAKALEQGHVGAINISTGQEVTILELWETLRDLHDPEHPMRHEAYRTGEVYRSVLDPARAKEQLGWEPKTSLQEGLEKTYQWFKDTFDK